MELTPRVCDLCHRHQPSFYCPSDSAFLCSHCDSQVHAANFLVARHIRLSLLVSNSPSSSPASSSSSSSSKTCNKTSCSSKTSMVSDWKTRDVLVNWCTRLGGSSSVIEVAKHAFEVSLVNRWVWPYRVGLAASLWLGLLRSFTKDDDQMRIRRLLKRLEEISGVPAKSIVVAESKLLKMMMKHHQRQHQDELDEEVVEEGWAEC